MIYLKLGVIKRCDFSHFLCNTNLVFIFAIITIFRFLVFLITIFIVNDYPVGRYLRDAKLMEIGAGTTEVRKIILGRYFNDIFLE